MMIISQTSKRKSKRKRGTIRRESRKYKRVMTQIGNQTKMKKGSLILALQE